jgi:LCP family protein required for cell wall assembly
MASFLQRKWVRIALPVLALVAGLLVGLLVIGWWLWPVQWTDALALDLAPSDREKYLDVVAESYTINRNVAAAQEQLATFMPEEQPALLADVQTRVARRLQKTENILVLGDDSHHNYAIWRTDSIMVIAIDRENRQVGVISIPRDLYVNIPDYGMERINVADYIGEVREYPGGGPALAGRVISDTLGIPTQHYVRVRLNGMSTLVDALGGITVYLDCPLYEIEGMTQRDDGTYDYSYWSLPAGEVHLDGANARKFATYRYATSDFSRSARQQQIIWALRNRALEVNLIPRLPELWSALGELYDTDLTLVDVARLAQFGMDLNPANVHSLGLGMDVLKNHENAEGASLLVVGDQALLDQKKEQLFMQKPLEQLGKLDTGKECPPPPTQ